LDDEIACGRGRKNAQIGKKKKIRVTGCRVARRWIPTVMDSQEEKKVCKERAKTRKGGGKISQSHEWRQMKGRHENF